LQAEAEVEENNPTNLMVAAVEAEVSYRRLAQVFRHQVLALQ
jgi:hypothetical protein